MPIFFQKCSFLTIFGHFWPFLTIFWKNFKTDILTKNAFWFILNRFWAKKFSKNFFKIFIFWSFLVIFWLFLTIFEFFGSKNEKKNLPPIAQYYYEFFKPSMRSLRLKMRLGLKIASIFLKGVLAPPRQWRTSGGRTQIAKLGVRNRASHPHNYSKWPKIAIRRDF